jgi:hypothetical protein
MLIITNYKTVKKVPFELISMRVHSLWKSLDVCCASNCKGGSWTTDIHIVETHIYVCNVSSSYCIQKKTKNICFIVIVSERGIQCLCRPAPVPIIYYIGLVA